MADRSVSGSAGTAGAGTVLLAAFGALSSGFPNSIAAGLSRVLNADTAVYAALLVPASRLIEWRQAQADASLDVRADTRPAGRRCMDLVSNRWRD